MITISTKEELKNALERKETQIIATGELAKSMRRRSKVRKGTAIGGAALVIAGIVAIPFTGGASAGLTAMGLTATALTIGTVTISTAELAILCGFTLGLAGLLTGARVTFNSDGSVTIEPRY